jgi:hypothetical protein
MPAEAPQEYLWFLEMSSALAREYLYQWIAIDGGRIAVNYGALAEIVVAHDASLDAVLLQTGAATQPSSLYYAFVDDVLEPVPARV